MQTKLVVDSSVILKWVYGENEQYIEQSQAVLQNALQNHIQMLTPELAKYEVFNVLLTAKKLPVAKAQEAIRFICSLPLNFVQNSLSLAEETYKIGLEYQITYYDASFVALAKQENTTLVTDNPKHQAKVKDIRVVSLKDYR